MANVKKLSVATVYGKPTLGALVAAQAAGKSLPAMRAIGFAVGFKTGESSFGAFTALQGDFACWPLDGAGKPTGEQQQSSTLYLPEIALTPILVALTNGAQSVKFAIDIAFMVVPEEKRKPGGSIYEYTFTNVLPPDTSSPMASLLADVALAEALSLAAPGTTQAEPEKETTAGDEKPAGKKSK